MKTLLSALILFIVMNARAQVSGFITDENNQPIAGATIKCYRDTALVKLLVTNIKGYFVCDKQTDHVVITFIGYQTLRLDAKNSLGQIRLKPNNGVLGQVNIVSQQPIVKQMVDRSVINVNSAVLKLADNALDVIRLAPGIIISDSEDAIALSGKDAVAVMINDKLVKLSSRDLVKLLKAMSAATVSRLEVMTNPSAKYDVTGNTALLNIKTQQNSNKGFTGDIDASSAQGGHNWGDASTLLNYGTDKLASNAYVAYHWGAYQTQYLKSTQINNAFLNQQNTSLDKWSDPVLRFTMDYFIDKKQTIGGLAEREVSTNTSTYQTQSGLTASNNFTDAYSPNVRHWNTYNLNYRYADTLGTELTFDFDHSGYHKHDESNLTNNLIPFQYLTLTDIAITTFKGDYTHVWKSKIKLEGGAKISSVNTGNDFSTSNANQNNHFLYHEKVNSVYINLGKNYVNWGVQIGVRVEHSQIDGLSSSNGMPDIRKPDSSYVNVLPALYLTYKNLRLSVNQRIRRPDYSDLQPFTYQVDAFDYQAGNPSLKAQQNTNAELTYTYHDRIIVTSSYTHTADLINPVILQTGAITYQTNTNTGAMDNYNINVNYPLKINKWWNMLNKLNAGYNHFNGQLYQGLLNEGKFNYQLSTSQRFTLPDKFQARLSGRYTSATQNLIYRQSSSGNVSLSLSRKLFHDQGSISLNATDVFKTQKNHVTVNFGNLQYTQHNTFESQRLGLDFTWHFGNAKIKQAQQRETGNSDEKGRSGK